MLSPDITPVPQAKPFLDAAAQFARGDDTPRAYLERCLDAFAVWEPKIGAFVHTNLDGARTAADASSRRWRDNEPLSAIDGMPIGIKDIIETADMLTGMGSPLFDGWCSGRDAAAVAALREAGAVILGKTVTTEFASFSKNSGIGLIILPDIFNIEHRALIIRLAAEYALPTIYPYGLF